MRMQHYAVFLQAFNFEIKYRKSADHGNADGFSRLPVAEKRLGEYGPIDLFQIENVETLPVTAKEIRVETRKDKTLLKIIEALEQGKSLVPLGYKDNEFALQNGIILRKERVIIPESLKGRILKELHAGHFGCVKMKNLSRNFCWWLGIDKDIETLVKNCKACNTFSNNPSSKIKHRWEPAAEPFQRVHVDFAGPFMSHNFLILVDAFTRWPEVHLIKSINAEKTIEKCRKIFTTFGLPQVLVSDNGRTFVSKEFKFFLEQNGIFHRCTAPYNLATNGLAERFVQTMKQGLRKLGATEKNVKVNLQKFLFYYRLLAHPESGKSPAELMFGRSLNSRLNLIFPKTELEVKSDRGNFLNVKQFKVGESVAVREYLNKNIKWRFGFVIEKLGKLHYNIRLQDGTIWKRHVNQMRAIGPEIVESSQAQVLDCGPSGITNTNINHEVMNKTCEQAPTSPEKEKPSNIFSQSPDHKAVQEIPPDSDEEEQAPDETLMYQRW
ncbi:PREDICTED: uncharacterized protein K02A2.6-like [Wasmannia auropunctata]|uniref:uncharacterized protein K02A2.6-like n=1 Tax=Wasmannia auropunctata TaxID=64793 RepID=UPI0005EEA2FA|nr:PREDICTED: uncharacterized protein K02A2.6-like [Wasmannia auropunctata]